MISAALSQRLLEDEETQLEQVSKRELVAKLRRELVALHAVRDGVETFEAFVGRVSPKYAVVPPHLKVLYALIQETRRRAMRITISMPPRHGKTTTFKHALAWRNLYDPACQNFYATFSSDGAEEIGGAVRSLMAAAGIPLGKGSTKRMDWKNIVGGGLKSTSVGGAITGRGANGGIIIVDDAIKGRLIANSKGERDKIWAWFKDDVMSRLEGGGSIIVCNTRWHEDDIIGRLMRDDLGETWIHINLPAISDGAGNPIDEKLTPSLAKPLWTGIDAMHPTAAGALEWLRKCRARGEYGWWSLYQGVPRSKDSKLFPDYPALFDLTAFLWAGHRGIILLDPAATASTTADYSALGVFAMDRYAEETRMKVIHVEKHQVTIPEIARRTLALQRRFKLPVGIEAVAGFKAVPQMIRELAPRLKVIEIYPLGDKYTRAQPASKAWKENRIEVPIDAPWVDDYVGVMNDFSGLGDAEDDVVDITAHAYNRMYKESPLHDGSSSYEQGA